MSTTRIQGAEFPIRKIFSNDFHFRIPLYQRPYSWTTEQAEELFDDLSTFVGDDLSQSVDELSPYFLGSIVLIKNEDSPDAEVVDGQQRLTTLTILISALRHCISAEQYSRGLTDYLYQEGSALEGTPNRYRLTIRERDAEFFKSYVQELNRIAELRELEVAQLPDARQNIRANAALFLDRLSKMPDEHRIRLAQFIVKNCLLVVVSTPDHDSAYRIFSILNDRGMDLSHSDILKSEIIGEIPGELQNTYNDRWEDAEEDLGRDGFADLFSHVRMIYRKQKMRGSVIKEFREFVSRPVNSSQQLVDDVLIPYADAFATIRSRSFQSTENAEVVNGWLTWLNRIDNVDWLPPAIYFLAHHQSDAVALKTFLEDLERLAAFMMICRRGINERIERYGKVLIALESGTDLYTDESPLQLQPDECAMFARAINGNVYKQVPKRRLYMLLRLDSALSDGSAQYVHPVLSIEHVLPQNPLAGSQWSKWFPTPEFRAQWVHRIGNLLLLSHKKNSSASNYDLEKKKTAYFTRNGISPFPLTTHVLQETEWDVNVLRRRQQQLVQVLMNVWRLPGDLPIDPSDDEEPDNDSSKAAVDFHLEMLDRVQERFEKKLVQQSQSLWAPTDNSALLSCRASKKYEKRSHDYWFGLKLSAKEQLEEHSNAWCAFGLGSAEKVVLIQFSEIAAKLNSMSTSANEDGSIIHWHFRFKEEGDQMLLLLGARDHFNVTEFLL